MPLIALYLAAIVAANVLVSVFGPAVSVVNAFLFIGLTLSTRDKLHDAWRGQHLKRNMFLLIAAGSLLSVLFNAGWIALASFVAFAASESTDAIVYHLLRDKRKLAQVNGSNVISAAVDSLVFPVIAFGLPVLWWVVVGQLAAKIAGGFVWSLLLWRRADAVSLSWRD